MPSALVRALTERHGLPRVDASSIDAFLAPAVGEAACTLLFFAGDPAQRSETDDVAVVAPQLLAAFAGRLRGAVVAREAEEQLKARFGVVVMPSLVVVRDGLPLTTIAKIRDWTEYLEKIGACLSDGARPRPRGEGPKTEFLHSGQRVAP